MRKLSEFERIETFKRILGPTRVPVLVGIGDDAALLRWPSKNLVVTTDCQVEEVHFSTRFSKPEEIGHRLLAVNLSDLAAMGATPVAAVVSLAVPRTCSDRFLERLYRGLARTARHYGVQVVGGNLSRSPAKMFLDLTLFGAARRPVLRSGARPGHGVAVTGTLGDAAVGLQALRRWGERARAIYPMGTKAHLAPTPLVVFGQKLAPLASSGIDISDGLSSELNHLATQSQVSIVVDEDCLPISSSTRKICGRLGIRSTHEALHGGEGFNLLFTFSPSKWKKIQAAAKQSGVGVTQIGRVESVDRARSNGTPWGLGTGVWLRTSDGRVVRLMPQGFQHF